LLFSSMIRLSPISTLFPYTTLFRSSDKRSKLERDGTFKFDCQIRNAAARIQTVRGRDCAGGTGFDTAVARSAPSWHRLVRRQFKSRQNFCEKKPGPESFVDEHRAFAMPANAGLRRMIAFQNWPGIDITFLVATELAKKLVDLVKLGLDQIMIVIAPGVARDSACGGRPVACLRVSMEIVQRKYND